MAALANTIIADPDDTLADLDLSSSGTSIAPEPAPLALVVSVPAIPALPTAPANERDAFYASLEASEAAELQATASRINSRHRAAVAGLIETGKDLIRIKDSISGHFDKWLKIEFEMSKGSAWNYINTALHFADVPKVVEILPPATVYKLAAKATPEDVRNAVVQEITSGVVPTKQDVERRIAEARQRAADEERARKQAEHEQAEAERQKREDEQAWQARAKELTGAGKTEAEIQKERQKWETATAKKAREKDNRLKAKQKREEEQQREHEARQVERDLQRQTAYEAADFIRERLGDDLEAFRSLLSKADSWTFHQILINENKETA
ncbi:hypothetical protein GCM10011491_01380 [Brucella endophytica]|uniref:DUF3102 domain-containing protein n=1 Tax=Brucella endophytica TaxID=1963359 RepID=A0A916RZB6_9HYPH|nr:hypothetical protein [Brucella endophytica]GGA77918.1 hypothetical protein GCM10011491_01380 [Brucella endophytica]